MTDPDDCNHEDALPALYCTCAWEKITDDAGRGWWQLTEDDEDCILHQAIEDGLLAFGDEFSTEDDEPGDLTRVPLTSPEDNEADLRDLLPDDLPWAPAAEAQYGSGDDEMTLEEALRLGEQIADEHSEGDKAEPERVYYDLSAGSTDQEAISWETLRERGWEPTGEVTVTKGTIDGHPACFVTWDGEGMDIYSAWGSIKTADAYITHAIRQVSDID